MTIRDAEELFDPDSQKPDGTEAFLDAPVKSNDPSQLKKKALSDKNRALQQENDLREILALPSGRRVLARVIEHCGWNTPHYHPSNSQMCEIAGRRSIAWQIENWICDTDLKLWFAVREELEQIRPKPKTSTDEFRSGRQR